MARMRNMVAKPASWIKKHWVKIVVAIVVIYAIYWFFGDDMEGYTVTRVHNASEIQQLKNDYEDAKDVYDQAVREYNDVLKNTYQDREGNSSTSSYCSTAASPVSPGVAAASNPGCKAYMLEKKARMDAAYSEYKPYMKKQKKRRSLNSRVRRFFGMRG